MDRVSIRMRDKRRGAEKRKRRDRERERERIGGGVLLD